MKRDHNLRRRGVGRREPEPPRLAGLGDSLRQLGVEVATGATGRYAGMVLTALESLADQADELERDRALWRSTMGRVRAEAYSWTDGSQPTNDDLLWCAKRIRFALDG